MSHLAATDIAADTTTDVTLALPSEIAERLAEMSEGARNRFAADAFATALADPHAAAVTEADAWWNGLTEAERAAERRLIEESSAQGDAGQVSDAKSVYKRVRAQSRTPNIALNVG